MELNFRQIFSQESAEILSLLRLGRGMNEHFRDFSIGKFCFQDSAYV